MRWVKLEDLEDAFADLAARVGNREDHMLDTRIYGKLLRYDPEVMVIVPQPYKRVRCQRPGSERANWLISM